MPQILITSTSFGKKDAAPLELLQSKGYEIIWNETGKPLESDGLVAQLNGCEGVIAGLDYFSADVFRQTPGLKVVARYGVGVDRVDLDAAKKAGIVVTNTPTANSDSVADLAIGLMLAVARKIVDAHQETLRGNWPKLFGVSLFQSTVGLIGLGRIGARVARRLCGFDCKVLVYDPFVDCETAQQHGCEKVDSLEFLLANSDFISLHSPATEQTRGIINARTLSLMKSTAILVNTARGELIVEDDLISALQQGKMGGAGLDAFAVEPPQIAKYENVPHLVLTPHIGAYTKEALLNMGMDSALDLIAVLEGRPPKYRVV
ncbi:MAG: phosphoglycerate dehydrogenase [Thermoguttaceae bacterium]